MVSEITRLYCQPDMTSSWFLNQGALHIHVHDGFWRSDHDFLIASHSNFVSGMVSEITRFYCKPDITSSWFLRQGALYGFWRSDHDFLTAFHSNVLSAMHGFQDNEVLLQSRCDIIAISPPGGRSTQFLDCRFWKGDPDFISVLHCNYTSIVHRSRFN